MSEAEVSRPFLFVGNSLWLDFVNTQIVEEGRPRDLLEHYSDFMDWLRQAGTLSLEEGERLTQMWKEEGAVILEQAHDLRRTLRGLAEQLATGGAASEDMLAAINARLRHNPSYRVLARTECGLESALRYAWKQPEDLFAPIAEAAADLLVNGDSALVRKCENPACILFFYDTTKNHARRWCSMSGCGNRMKQAAHYRRSRTGNS